MSDFQYEHMMTGLGLLIVFSLMETFLIGWAIVVHDIQTEKRLKELEKKLKEPPTPITKG